MHALLNTRGDDPIIDEIWSWDAVSQGDSSLINKQNLGALREHCFQPHALVPTNPYHHGCR